MAHKINCPCYCSSRWRIFRVYSGSLEQIQGNCICKNIEIYSELVRQLLEFALLCSPNQSITFEQYGKIIISFTETQNAFFRASLFIPDVLYKDIRDVFTPANDRLAKIHATLSNLNQIKNGNVKSEQELGAKDFSEFKTNTLNALEDFQNLPGPFTPLIAATPRIVKMLKKDLGISVLDSKFYQK